MINIMKLKFIFTSVVFGILALIYLFWTHFSDNYYQKSNYTVGTRNDTKMTLHNTVTTLIPVGQDPCGILGPGKEARYMDPRWPVPQKINITFDDELNVRHALSLDTKLSTSFHGDITVIITQTNSVFNIRLE
jgi:hypothetical protein